MCVYFCMASRYNTQTGREEINASPDKILAAIFQCNHLWANRRIPVPLYRFQGFNLLIARTVKSYYRS